MLSVALLFHGLRIEGFCRTAGLAGPAHTPPPFASSPLWQQLALHFFVSGFQSELLLTDGRGGGLEGMRGTPLPAACFQPSVITPGWVCLSPPQGSSLLPQWPYQGQYPASVPFLGFSSRWESPNPQHLLPLS